MSLARRARRLTPVLALSLVPAYGFVAVDAGVGSAAAPLAQSSTLEHVKQLPYELRHGATKMGGTDLEFVDLDVPANRVATAGSTPIVDADPDKPRLQRTFSLAGSYENGLQIVDVTVPEQATIVTSYDCGVYQGDVQIFTREDLGGRTFATFTQDNSSRSGAKVESTCYQELLDKGLRKEGQKTGTIILDITDPYAPTAVGFVEIPLGSHNQTVHPSGRYLYNSNSELITNAADAGIEIFDITDLANPEHVTTFALPVRPGLGTDSHDLTFNSDGTRAYSAALSQTVIIDTTNPEAPALVSSFMDPAINVEHQADPVTLTDPILGERTFLFVEDEFAGAAGGEQTCPSGGVHIYDITGDLENNPVKVGYWNIDDVTTTRALGRGRCTAHVFELHEDEALMNIAFYNLGVSVVDLSSLVGVSLGATGAGLKEVAFAHFSDSDTWAVKAPYVDRDGTFYIYGNDQ
ncbi:MAG: hypothetical protein KY457_00285, partial [Actinobacteria bacterium]|nr:hypothetical protein [Actinomycetota bacterium]